ncbi:MAG: amidase [Rhodospirillales bacterium]|nr:amidase [Rhodospirillales bacterium]
MEMVSNLKRGAVSPSEALVAAYTRIEAVDNDVHALPTLCRDRAENVARTIEDDKDTQRERRNDPSWLAGLPVAIKDLTDVEGVRTTYGSPIYTDHVPDKSDILVQQLEANGAVIIGKSNSPEFGAGGNSFNEVFPSTRTPWDTSRTSGGSSGGAAAALASGQVWLANGSDLGGSLRTPASFCGIVGLRPSPGRIASGPNPQPFNTLAVEGPMARDVADTALFLDAMVGMHPADPLSLGKPEASFRSLLKNFSGKRRVAFSPDLGISPVDPEVIKVCERAVTKLSDMGWEITDQAPDIKGSMETFQVLRAASFAAGMSELLDTNRALLKPDIIWNIEKGLKQSQEDVAKAECARGTLYHKMVTFFESHDLLICPTACTLPFDVEQQSLKSLGDHAFDNYMEWLALPSVLSLTSCPVLSLPVGFSEAGLPVGMQLVAPPRAEHLLLAAAYKAEQALEVGSANPIDPKTF